MTPPYASFAGPVNNSTYKLKYEIFWPEGQDKASGFVCLGTYIVPTIFENEYRSPGKGVHVFHIFMLFPLNQQPWKAMYEWMKAPKG
jgi:hypothetical protein